MSNYWDAFLTEIGVRIYSLPINFLLELFYYYLNDGNQYKKMIDSFDKTNKGCI